jgi:hypothetical protein
MIYPGFVNTVHQVMKREDVLRRVFSTTKAKCIVQVVETLLDPLTVTQDPVRLSNFTENIKWFQTYFDKLTTITVKRIPVLNSYWLYAFIYCLYPHLERYLLNPPKEGGQLTVSMVLNGEAERILMDKEKYHSTVRRLFKSKHIHRVRPSQWYQNLASVEYINTIPSYF